MKRTELIDYLDGCHRAGIPINKFTYWVYRTTHGYGIRSMTKNIQRFLAMQLNK